MIERFSQTMVEEAIEILDMCASTEFATPANPEFDDSYKAQQCASRAYWDVYLSNETWGYSVSERFAEAAQLLRDGWRPGQKLVRR